MISEKHKVILVDDHNLFRRGISELINGFLNFEVIAGFENGKVFSTNIKNQTLPDIAIVDINMPEMDGYETCRWIKEHYPDIKVLALSMYDDERAIIQMMKSGAKGYILKDADPKELENALEEIMLKGYYYSKLVGEIMLKSVQEFSISPSELNEREINFLKYACSELTYKEIAAKMFVSPRTVDGYRENLCKKLEIKNRVGLVLYAIKHGIFQLD